MAEPARKISEIQELENLCVLYNTQKVMYQNQVGGVEKLVDEKGNPTGTYKILIDEHEKLISKILDYVKIKGNSPRVREMLKALGPKPSVDAGEKFIY